MSTLTKHGWEQRRRTVPMKVLVLGLSRTGTVSISRALLNLGFKDCYHQSSIYQGGFVDAPAWVEALEAKYEGKGEPFGVEQWDKLLGHCMAVTDSPCVVFYRELLEVYPEAKVVLSVRDSPEQWYNSVMNTIVPMYEVFHSQNNSLYNRIRRFFVPESPFHRMNELLLHHYMYKDFARNGKQFYIDHITEVERIVPKDKLLVYNVKQGWDPLCRFLGVDIPAEPFPKTNDTKKFQEEGIKHKQALDRMAAVRLAKVVGVAVMVALTLGVSYIGLSY